MTTNDFLDILSDSFFDSLIVFVITFFFHFLLSFFEDKLNNFLLKKNKLSTLIGSFLGIIPQCSVSVIASDLYVQNKITTGTIIAIFFACSDEALPVLFTDFSKSIYIIPLLLIKCIFGFILGYSVDFFYKPKQKEESTLENKNNACNHNNSWLDKHVIHSLLHSLKIFLYVFLVSFVFSLLIFFIKIDNIKNFISSNIYLSPLFSCLIGLIPSCFSSVILTELFIDNIIPFGALLSGLCINAGLGLLYLLKNKTFIKKALLILSILFISSLLSGYLTMLIMNLIGL